MIFLTVFGFSSRKGKLFFYRDDNQHRGARVPVGLNLQIAAVQLQALVDVADSIALGFHISLDRLPRFLCRHALAIIAYLDHHILIFPGDGDPNAAFPVFFGLGAMEQRIFNDRLQRQLGQHGFVRLRAALDESSDHIPLLYSLSCHRKSDSPK